VNIRGPVIAASAFWIAFSVCLLQIEVDGAAAPRTPGSVTTWEKVANQAFVISFEGAQFEG